MDKTRVASRESDTTADLTRLKSFSQIEETAYRDFSQQRAGRRSLAHRRLEETRKPLASAGVEIAPAPVPAPAPAPAAASSASVPLPSREAALPLLTPPAVQRPPITALTTPPPVAYPTSAVASAAIAVFSLAGGVGKSAISAHLVRSLYARGERVLLVNGSGHSLLSMYFGASDEREGLRQFCAPGETHASVLLYNREQPDREWLTEEVEPLMPRVDRTIFDLGNAPHDFTAHALSACQVILVPVCPSPQASYAVSRVLALTERLCAHLPEPPRVYFVLNQFDERREQDRRLVQTLESLVGDALLPIVLSANEELHAAFAERMTLGDYHPSAQLAQQFEKLAGWLRKTLPPTAPAQARRWSEV